MKMNIIDAVLIKDVIYHKEGQEYLIKNQTFIKVDIYNSIALIDNDHFDIARHEYMLFN